MLIENNEVTSQPAPATAQTSDEGRGKNVTASKMAEMLLRTATPAKDTSTVAPASSEPNKPQEEATQNADSGSPAEASPQPDQNTAPEAPVTEAEPEVLSQDSEQLPPDLQEKIDKRIGKEVAKRKTLEDQLAMQREELEKLKAAVAQPQEAPSQAAPTVIDPSQPLSHIGTVDALNAEHKQAKSIIRASEELLDQFDSGVDSVEYGGQTFTKAQVKQALRNAKLVVEEQVPQRYQFLQARDGWKAKAVEEFPFLKDRTTKEYQMVEQARRNYPIIASLPDADYVLGLAVEGIKAIEARKAAKPAAKTAAKAPASQVATSATSTRARVADDSIQREQVGREVAAIKSQKRNLSTNDVTAILLKQSTLRPR